VSVGLKYRACLCWAALENDFDELFTFSQIEGASMSKYGFRMVVGLAVAIVATLAAAPAEAIVVTKVIDKFQDDSMAMTGSSIGSTSTSTTVEGVLGNIYGTERDVYVNKTAGPTTPSALRRVTASADGTLPGSFFIDRGPLVSGNALLQWDGLDGIAPSAFDPLSNLAMLAGPWNLTSDVGLVVRLAYGETDQMMQFTLFSSATAASTHLPIPVPNFAGPGTVDLLIPFAAFAQSGLGGVVSPVDFSDVRAITMAATNSVSGRDVEFRLLGVYVPEPATASIFGIGSVLAFGAFRRFRPSRDRRSSELG
jgi:hypothetical protein